MTYREIVAPAAMAVSLEDARIAARANGNDLDSELQINIKALTKEAEHETGRAIIYRTYRVTLDSFPDAIRLPMPPVSSVTSVKYLDLDGEEQTLHPDDYYVDAVSEPGYIVPARGLAWPSTLDQINAVNVVVVCGYGASDAATPEAFKAYILGRLREMYAPPGTPSSPYLQHMLDSLKVY